jgi:hypothetical protein
MAAPTSIRFDDDVLERLASYAARHPGWTRSSIAARYVEEGLRMDEHPGVMFRDGPMGRRATLMAGPDVWEVVRDVMSARAAEPKLNELELLQLIEDNTGVHPSLVRTALDYWAAHRDEVEALIAHSERVGMERLATADAVNELLSS